MAQVKPKSLAISDTKEMTLKQKVDLETKNRQIILEYIKENLTEGTDFGVIPMPGREAKKSLFKPGSEKVASLLKLKVRFVKDDDTWQMAGSPAGCFCYKAELIDSNDRVVGEGRGACTVQERQQNINTAIKIAEKRAQIDAVLRVASLSDVFAQDLEDLNAPNQKVPEKIAPMSLMQRTTIMRLLKLKGKTQDDLDTAIATFNLKDYKLMNVKEASLIIQRLNQLPDVPPADVPTTQVNEETKPS